MMPVDDRRGRCPEFAPSRREAKADLRLVPMLVARKRDRKWIFSRRKGFFSLLQRGWLYDSEHHHRKEGYHGSANSGQAAVSLA